MYIVRSCIAAVTGGGPAFDATAVLSPYASGTTAGQASTWVHPAAAGAYAIVTIYAYGSNVTAGGVPSFGGSSMGLLGSVKLNNSTFGTIFVFGLSGVAGGNNTVSINPTTSTRYSCWADSYTFTNVTSVGALQTAYGSSTAPALSVPTTPGDIVWGAIANVNATPAASAYSAFSLTQEQYEHTSGDYPYYVSGYTTATGLTVPVSATQAASRPWAAVGLDLM